VSSDEQVIIDSKLESKPIPRFRLGSSWLRISAKPKRVIDMFIEIVW
jgi:hypothetical protein